MRKFANCLPFTSAFGGSFPGGRAGVFRCKTVEKRRKCSWHSAAVFETEREARECGGLGAQPPRKVRRVERLWCVVSFAERVVASLRLHGVRCGCSSRAAARRSSSVRRRRVRSPDENESNVVASGLLDAVRPDPKGSPEPLQ